MRRASFKLLSHIRKPHPRIPISLSTRDFSAPSLSSPPKPVLEFSPASQSSRFSTSYSNRFPPHNLSAQNPFSQDAPQMSSRQRRIKEKSELEEAFEAAESLDEMLAAFKEMEASFDEKDLALACLKIGLKLDRDGDDPEKTLSFAQRALRIFDENEGDSGKKMSLPIAMTLHLLGSSSFGLKRFSESLGYLSRANRVLSKLEGESSYSPDQALEIKEMIFDEDSKELGNANRDVAEAYVAVLNFKEALPFCEKAVEIHKAHFESALAKGVEEMGRSADLLRAEIDAANMQIALGRHEEAISTLKGVVQQTEKESEEHAMVFTSMAKALCNQEKFVDAKKCLEIACGVLEKKERSSPLVVVEAYMEITTQYETMNEFETAISLLTKALQWKVEEAIPYLEDAAERLKESFGLKHFSVGYVYNNLGAAYMELDRPQSAAQTFAYAKEIMDVSLGPHHADSIEACQNLSKAYAAMGSYPLAMNFQEKVVEGWEGHGPSAEDELKELFKYWSN
ncbi:hypothetical protein SASPL_135281 [Salvia splendens]|uniref:Kinesin light chain n=1 Tax=Salvia splendens TaxID=180675 RepID=A0A8X8ZGG9_SALSN|nr:hypothetical protein SASPL_135281 [Salvia splendens]